MVYLLAGLAAPAGEALPTAGPLVLLVGDRKQSIYAFRGADVSVFGQAMQRFREGSGQVAFLSENFRSRSELIAFYNRLFPQVFGHAIYRTLAPEVYVDFAADDQQVQGRPQEGDSGPAVEVLDCRDQGHERTSLGQWRQIEARALACHLRGFLEQGGRAEDVVILFRRLTQVETYERALSAAGLDYYTVGGKGFYQCQEVGDLLLAMQTLLDPTDGLALAGFLRSPLVGLSDESLLALGFSDQGEPRTLGQALAQDADLPEWLGLLQRERWQAVRAWLAHLQPLARRYAPAELLECLVEASDLLPVWLGTSGGEQRAANLRKLIESARDPRLAGGGVEEFWLRLRGLMQELSEDAQAPLMGEEAPVIRLMSIHQAKGLEFPVVALADLAFKPRHTVPLLGPGGVLGMKSPDPKGGPACPTPFSLGLLARQWAVEEAEAARLFYVALTRARQHLIFCLHGAPEKEQGYWGYWLATWVLPDPETRLVTPGVVAAPASAPVALVALPGVEVQFNEARRVLGRSLHRRFTPTALVNESVSALEDWLACPRRYVFSRRLMLNSTWRALSTGRGGAGEADAAVLGSAVHRLLELTDLTRGPAGLTETLARLDLEVNLAARAASLAVGWWHCGLPQLLAELGPGELRREQGFSLLLPAQDGAPALEMIGEFDLLVRPAGGPPLLVDYKVTEEWKPEKYRAQMALYALALWQGQGPQTPPPRTLLCYLSQKGARLIELALDAAELEQWRGRLSQAARDIAGLPVLVSPLDLPPGDECPGRGCGLHLAELCLGYGQSVLSKAGAAAKNDFIKTAYWSS
ncbi:hypothetical protein DFAR_150001 [Desulfarculales bacterium]